jgi:hypothetical protein
MPGSHGPRSPRPGRRRARQDRRRRSHRPVHPPRVTEIDRTFHRARRRPASGRTPAHPLARRTHARDVEPGGGARDQSGAGTAGRRRAQVRVGGFDLLDFSRRTRLSGPRGRPSPGVAGHAHRLLTTGHHIIEKNESRAATAWACTRSSSTPAVSRMRLRQSSVALLGEPRERTGGPCTWPCLRGGRVVPSASPPRAACGDVSTGAAGRCTRPWQAMAATTRL